MEDGECVQMEKRDDEYCVLASFFLPSDKFAGVRLQCELTSVSMQPVKF